MAEPTRQWYLAFNRFIKMATSAPHSARSGQAAEGIRRWVQVYASTRYHLLAKLTKAFAPSRRTLAAWLARFARLVETKSPPEAYKW
jgi:hypothetical protein